MGVLFLLAGIILVLIAKVIYDSIVYYTSNGTKSMGRVAAIIEGKSSRHNRTATIFTPIIEYTFNGEQYWFSNGGSSNDLYKYKIDQRVPIVFLSKGPEYVKMEKGLDHFFFKLTLAMGTLSIAFGLYHIKHFLTLSLPLKLVALVFSLFELVIIIKVIKKTQFLKSKNLDEDIILKAQLHNEEQLNNYKFKVYRDNKEIERIRINTNRLGLYISGAFALGMILANYITWSKLSIPSKNLIQNYLSHFNNFDEIKNVVLSKSDPLLILFLLLLIMSCASAYSLVYSLKKLS